MISRRQTRDMVLSNYLQMRAPLILLDLDQDGLVTEANRYARNMLGTDCIGRPFSCLILDFHNKFSLMDLRTKHAGVLLSFKTKDNYPVSLKTFYLPLGTGGLVIGEQNLEESEELHNSLLHLNNELNTISRDLQKKTIQLQQVNDLKNQFLGMAAHDLRNPLATVYTYIDILRDDLHSDRDGTALEAFNEIQQQMKYMMNLVSNLLDYSVIEQGRLDLDKQPVEIHQLVSQAVQSNRLLSAKRNVTITLLADKTPCIIMIDLHKIRQVLNNLISNAVKFSPSDATVTVKVEKAEISSITISVTDQGPGIPDEMRNRLFVPFGKTNQQSFSGEKSTGLGLAICRKMIEAHGGTIGFESPAGQGSRFWFTLPLSATT